MVAGRSRSAAAGGQRRQALRMNFAGTVLAMRKVDRSALVPYKAEEMFALVEDVASYPDFLPWCTAAEVHSRSDDVVEASLELQKGVVSKRFTTRNVRHPFDSIELSLVGGPFRVLRGGWRFKNLGDAGCKVSLNLEFEFESRLLDMLFGAYFEENCNALVDAFSNRAATVFGAR
jgi:ribosome-associated toxin RatA of RatAB toxin-antitoxin module